ncbi:hypothetical protein D3C85_1488670 [compost metagenome]
MSGIHGTKKPVDIEIITLFNTPRLGDVSIMIYSYPNFSHASRQILRILVIVLSA